MLSATIVQNHGLVNRVKVISTQSLSLEEVKRAPRWSTSSQGQSSKALSISGSPYQYQKGLHISKSFQHDEVLSSTANIFGRRYSRWL